MHCLSWLDRAIWRNIYASFSVPFVGMYGSDFYPLDSPEAAVSQDEEVNLRE